MQRFLSVMIIMAGTWGLVPCFAGEVDNIAVATAMVAAINERDLDGLDSIVATDVVRHSAATPGVAITNLAEFKAFLETDFNSVPDSKMAINVIFGNDEFVAMRIVYSGTQTNPLGSFPATGKRFDLPFIGILKIEGGKISEMWVEWDNLYLLTTLGHFPIPAEP